MANLRTMKNGDLFVLKDGSVGSLLEETGIDYVTGIMGSSSTALVFTVDTDGDLDRRTGNHFLTVDFDAAGTEEIDLTHPIKSPVFYHDGTNLHVWYGYDGAGGTAYLVYHDYSTDNGATWNGQNVCVTRGTGGTWNDGAVVPIGMRYVDADTSYLFVMGNDDTTWRLGRWTIDTSGGGGLPVEYATAVNYSAYGSNPVFLSSGVGNGAGAVIYADGLYHLWHGDDATPSGIYYHWSENGLQWYPASLYTKAKVLPAGVATTLDVGWLQVTGATYYRGWYYVFYVGYDNTNKRAMVAVGDSPDRLYKMMNLEELQSGDFSQVYYAAGDLTFEVPSFVVHVPDRGKIGALVSGTEAPYPAAFTFKHQQWGDNGAGAPSDSPNLLNHLFRADPAVGEGAQMAKPYGSSNILFRVDDPSTGLPDEFALLLECTAAMEFSEAADSNNVRVSVMCNGSNGPLFGAY